ncbi:GGDEF domain-containing protein [Thermaerobacter sp. PB12/4term]|uniref:GGDEF domain-containing protein n=1 Tax=Thermaerobacter sp. PB12/4term TaxID=2293838 RepID=UPI001314AF31|nr:GGDEF domain-containing protein [Thermaerobacter sp. PB12/4term]QIA27724.1 GGDEF domain-containing protein [Thermaerobacter sp. PB12/4term]
MHRASVVPQSRAWAHERGLGVWVRANHIITSLVVALAVERQALDNWLLLSLVFGGAYGLYLAWLRRRPVTEDVVLPAVACSLAFLVYVNLNFILTDDAGLAGEIWRSGPAVLLMVTEVFYVARFLPLRPTLAVSGAAFTFSYLRAYMLVRQSFARPNEAFGTIIRTPEVWAVVLETWAMVPLLLFILREYYLSRQKAETDGLTGLLNHRSFYETLSGLLREGRDRGRPVSLVLLDVDHFKRFNDRYGHRSGDRVLQEVAGLLCADVRRTDVVFRYGGEEFAVLLPGASSQEALDIAERLRSRVESHLFRDARNRPVGRVTVSAGVATFPDHAGTAEQLVEAADQALYAAKYSSRNAVRVCGQATAPEAAEGVAYRPSPGIALRRCQE